MNGLSGSELMIYGGIALMGIALVAAVVGIIIFAGIMRRLKKTLEEDYGKMRH